MWYGPEPGSARCEITWTKVKNTVAQRMVDDSLIHLFTEKKRLKRRTKLLNSHLRESVNHTISYTNYIKAKTAVLRTLSEDEETSESDGDDDLSRRHDESVNPATSALRALLKDMMLESQDSSDEFEPKRREVRAKRGRGRPRGALRNKSRRRKTSNTSGSDSEWNKSPVAVVKRPRGRPRKYPLASTTPGTRPSGVSLRSSKSRGKCPTVGDESSTKGSEDRPVVGQDVSGGNKDSGEFHSSSLIEVEQAQDGFNRRKLRSSTCAARGFGVWSGSEVSECERVKSPEVEVKRPRGRPKKHPLEADKGGGKNPDVQSSKGISEAGDSAPGHYSNGDESVVPGVECSMKESELRAAEEDSNVEKSEELESLSLIQARDQDDGFSERRSRSKTIAGEKDSDIDAESDEADSSTSMQGDKPEEAEYSTRPRTTTKKRASSVDDTLEKSNSTTVSQENKFIDVDSLRRTLMSRRIPDKSENSQSPTPDGLDKSQGVESGRGSLRWRTISTENDPTFDGTNNLEGSRSRSRTISEKNATFDESEGSKSPASTNEKKPHVESLQKAFRSNNSASRLQEVSNTIQIRTPKPPGKSVNPSNDMNAHIFEKISKMISNGVDPHLAAHASRIYSTDDSTTGEETPRAPSNNEAEFRTPQTSDCEDPSDEDEKKHEIVEDLEDSVPTFPTSVSEDNFMDSDDMFEEEKTITQSQLFPADESAQCVEGNDLKDQLERDVDVKESSISPEENVSREEKPLDGFGMIKFMEMSNVEDPKSETFNDEKQESDCLDANSLEIPFTQEFDDKHEETIKNIEEYVENIVKEFDEKFPIKTSPPIDSRPSACQKSTTPGQIAEEKEQVSQSSSRGSTKSTGKVSIRSGSVTKVVRSPKTPEDVKRNLMATLDRVSYEASLGGIEKFEDNSSSIESKIITPARPTSSLDGEDSRPRDESPVAPADSGIDEESRSISPQDYRVPKGEELDNSRKSPTASSASNHEMDKVLQMATPDKNKNEPETSSPSKKLVNLKITCTEVVTSKYLIIKPRKDENEGDLSSKESPTVLRKVTPRSDRTGSRDELTHSLAEFEDENSQSQLRFREGSGDTFYNYNYNYDYNSDGADYGASDQGFPSGDHEEDEWERSRREQRMSLAVVSEAESLKYVLNSLARRNHVDGWCEEEGDDDQEELLMGTGSDLAGGPGNSEEEGRILSRPTSISEFIEGTDLLPLESDPSFTLGDIGEDDDIYLIEIPKTILERDLVGQRFRLGERKIFIGEHRYDIQRKETEPLSCILHCGDKRNRYKTGIIEPVEHIIIRQQFRDDLMTTPKMELESRVSVPFPKNIKSRNPLVLVDQGSDGDELMSMRTGEEGDQSQQEDTPHSRGRKRRASLSDEAEGSDGNWNRKRRRVLVQVLEDNERNDSQEEEEDGGRINAGKNKRSRGKDEGEPTVGEEKYEEELGVRKGEEEYESLEEFSIHRETPGVLKDDSEVAKEDHEDTKNNIVINPSNILGRKKNVKEVRKLAREREDRTDGDTDASLDDTKLEEKPERLEDDHYSRIAPEDHSEVGEDERGGQANLVVNPLGVRKRNKNNKRDRKSSGGLIEGTDRRTEGSEELSGDQKSDILQEYPDSEATVEEHEVHDQLLPEVSRKQKISANRRQKSEGLTISEDEMSSRICSNDLGTAVHADDVLQDDPCQEDQELDEKLGQVSSEEESHVDIPSVSKVNSEEDKELECPSQMFGGEEISRGSKTHPATAGEDEFSQDEPKIDQEPVKKIKKSKKLRKLFTERESLIDIENNSDVPIKEEEKIEEAGDQLEDEKHSITSKNHSEIEVNGEASEDQAKLDPEKMMRRKKKKKSKKLRKLEQEQGQEQEQELVEQESLVDNQNISDVEVKEEEEPRACEDVVAVVKRSKKSKKSRQSCQDREVFIISQKPLKTEVKENDEESQSHDEEFKVPKRIKKSKKRKRLWAAQESSDTSDVSASEVESSVRRKKKKKGSSRDSHENYGSEDTTAESPSKVRTDEVKTPKKSFYEQMMEDSD